MTAPARRPEPARRAYRELARVYDRVYAWKDYAGEARRIRALVRRWGPRPSRRLLDVACGTAAHIEHLRRWFDCVGLDESKPMLAVARSRLPGIRFVRGKLQSVRLGELFDVVTCLFSAIGYVRSESELRAACRTFARHLVPGGLLVLEPWITPARWRPGTVHVTVQEDADGPLARVTVSTTRRRRSFMEMHYLSARAGAVDYWREQHDMALFSDEQMRFALEDAGFRVRHYRRGFTGDRGLYVGQRLPASISKPRIARKLVDPIQCDVQDHRDAPIFGQGRFT